MWQNQCQAKSSWSHSSSVTATQTVQSSSGVLAVLLPFLHMHVTSASSCSLFLYSHIQNIVILAAILSSLARVCLHSSPRACKKKKKKTHISIQGPDWQLYCCQRYSAKKQDDSNWTEDLSKVAVLAISSPCPALLWVERCYTFCIHLYAMVMAAPVSHIIIYSWNFKHLNAQQQRTFRVTNRDWRMCCCWLCHSRNLTDNKCFWRF